MSTYGLLASSPHMHYTPGCVVLHWLACRCVSSSPDAAERVMAFVLGRERDREHSDLPEVQHLLAAWKAEVATAGSGPAAAPEPRLLAFLRG